ncbi:MAG TPA: class I SAM-dependent methyltransferase [Pyrinomonadaceae bacterium]|nr:class I SAM-dependent methyltransferase [Pyrinomonadaceae bacterium]
MAASEFPMKDQATGELGHYDAMRKFWDQHWSDTHYANEYATNLYPRRQEEFQTIMEYLPRTGLVLEAGCSFGHVAEYFRVSGYQVVGLDYVFDSLAVGRQKAPALTVTQGDIHSLPFADNSLGGYLSFGVLEHFEFGPMPALREAFRVLKPHGVIAVTMPLPSPLIRDWIPRVRPWLSLDPLRRNSHLRRVFGKAPLTSNGGLANESGRNGFYEQPYSPRAVHDFFTKAGFEVVVQRPIYHSFWWWLVGEAFRETNGYYQSNKAGEVVARYAKTVFPWSTAFMSLAIGIKPN